MSIDVEAGPGVESSILLLRLSQRVCLPVGQPLTLRDFLAENDGVNLLQAEFLDAKGSYHFLQINIMGRVDFRAFASGIEVVTQGEPNFEYGFALQQLEQ